jgi:hypothetical protein
MALVTEAGFFRGVPDGVMSLVLDRVIDGPAGQAEAVRILRPAPVIADAVAAWITSGHDYEHFGNAELRARWERISRLLV